MRGPTGTGRCVGTPETVVPTSAIVSEATVLVALGVEPTPVASVLESPATFEATAASCDAADMALRVAGEVSAAVVDGAAGVSATMWTGDGVYVPSGTEALAGIWTVAVYP